PTPRTASPPLPGAPTPGPVRAGPAECRTAADHEGQVPALTSHRVGRRGGDHARHRPCPYPWHARRLSRLVAGPSRRRASPGPAPGPSAHPAASHPRLAWAVGHRRAGVAQTRFTSPAVTSNRAPSRDAGTFAATAQVTRV